MVNSTIHYTIDTKEEETHVVATARQLPPDLMLHVCAEVAPDIGTEYLYHS